MSAPRSIRRRAERAAKKAGDMIFEVHRVFVSLEVTMLDPETLKVRDVKTTEPKAIHEADFPAGLADYITADMRERGAAKVQNLQSVPRETPVKTA